MNTVEFLKIKRIEHGKGGLDGLARIFFWGEDFFVALILVVLEN